MADVFLSYSRRDSEFVRRLADALEARGKDVWVDIEGIRDGEVFPAALRSAVEGSDGFVFVISPDSVASNFCEQEVDHALELSKRIVPLVHRRVPDENVPEPIRERNWIPFEAEDMFDDGVDRLVTALDTDLEHTKAHTRWLVKSLEWNARGHDKSVLVRGSELAEAERWLAEAGAKEPEPTPFQYEYIAASRGAATRRLRILAGAMAVAFAVSIALAVVALSQRNQARHQSKVATSRELAAVSENQLQIDPELAVLLGIQAVKKQPTPQALLALRQALDSLALRKTLLGHQDVVTSVAFSPDGKLLTSTAPGAGDMSVRVWDLRSGRQLYALYPNGKPQRATGPPPGSRRPGSAGAPPTGAPGSSGPVGNVPVYVKKGQLPAGVNRGRQFPDFVTFGPGGKQLFVGLDTGGVAIYDVASGRKLAQAGGKDAHVDRINLTADGRLLLVSGAGGPVLADVAHRRPLRQFTLPGTSDKIFDSDISPDGRYAAGAGPWGYAIWDVRTGKLLHRLPGTIGDGVAFSPHGDTLAFGGHDGIIGLIDPRSGRERVIAHVAPAGPNQIAWSPDGERLGAALTDGTARIWDVASGNQIERFAGHRCCVIAVRFSPDGHLLATGAEDHKVNLWSAGGNALSAVHAARSQITGLTFTPGGGLAITAKGGPALSWTPGSKPHPLAGMNGIGAISASPDGRTLALAGPGRQATIVDAASGRVVRVLRLRSAVHDVRFDRTGKRIAVASAHGTTIFSATSGAPQGVQDAPVPVDGASFEANGSLLESVEDVGQQGGGALWLKQVPSGRLLAGAASPGPFTALALNPASTLVAAVARADPGIRIADASNLKETRELLGHVSDVNALAWSRDGRMLVSGGNDGTVRVWNPATGDPLRIIQHGAPVDAVAFNRDGSRLAFGDQDGNVELWTGCPGCFSPKLMLQLARRAVTRPLSALERRTFLGK